MGDVEKMHYSPFYGPFLSPLTEERDNAG